MARRFALIRDEHDPMNAPGVVAEGVVFASGKVALNWTTKPHSIQTFDSMADLMVVQRKNTITRIQWLDKEAHTGLPAARTAGIHRLHAAQDTLQAMLGKGQAEVNEEDHGVLIVLGERRPRV